MTLDELLQTVPAEVKPAIEQIEHKAGTSDADWQFIKAAGELLAAAKAANVCPVNLSWCYESNECDIVITGMSDEDSTKFGNWLRERMKERGEG